jgi:hypothetical protein
LKRRLEDLEDRGYLLKTDRLLARLFLGEMVDPEELVVAE